MTSRVLVVDDDEEIRTMLASTLAFAGFQVDLAEGATPALASLAAHRPDVVILDVTMPGTDGYDLVQLIRSRDADLPVLFLSARDAVEDRVRGLRLGGDDYVTKPFSAVEVVARIEALMRRGSRTEAADDPRMLRLADLTMDLAAHRVEREGREISLSPTEFRLLELLLVNAGRVLSKGQILEDIWMYDFGGDTNVVERFISNLRRKVDDGHTPLIHTIRGFGYSLRTADGA
ncbi:response regulator transcription factor [Demequina capsici]|uniref:Response regulator transcription factor n=1 Tax=Demequina capsici TaxID=3075620 RepID=A0AA96F859_9MICO|nr:MULTISPECIES: response regulator transcription factor [unclassified Demequina]WNM23756.1 response regulator transcription factor [Demequina sp. OYTSA14]WNM26595.1 response regulator transcription factor [Demequina sp. PMTSA13]